MFGEDRRASIPVLHGRLEHIRLRTRHRFHHRYCHGGHDGGLPGLADASPSRPSLQNRPDSSTHQSCKRNPKTPLCSGMKKHAIIKSLTF